MRNRASRRKFGNVKRYVWLILLLGAVAVFGVGLAFALSLAGPEPGLQYRVEWVRALLQVGLVAVFGVVTSLVLERFKDALQQRRDESRLRFQVLKELSRTYMNVKLLRRKVQKSGGAFNVTDARRLNKIQVNFELHKQNSVMLFHEKSELKLLLFKMEDYLNDVANDADSDARKRFSSTEGFRYFADTFKAAATLIRKEIGGR